MHEGKESPYVKLSGNLDYMNGAIATIKSQKVTELVFNLKHISEMMFLNDSS